MKHQTPGAQDDAKRFVSLMSALEDRFPDPAPFSAAPPEQRYIATIDRLITKVKEKDHLIHQCQFMTWTEVTKVLRELKKKKHSKYYVHVDETEIGIVVKMFKRAEL